MTNKYADGQVKSRSRKNVLHSPYKSKTNVCIVKIFDQRREKVNDGNVSADNRLNATKNRLQNDQQSLA